MYVLSSMVDPVPVRYTIQKYNFNAFCNNIFRNLSILVKLRTTEKITGIKTKHYE